MSPLVRPRTLAPFLLLPLLARTTFGWAPPASTKAPSLRGLVRTNTGILWASGTEGTVLRSTNEGASWQTCSPMADGVTLDFRGIQAFDKQRAIIMSAGTGSLSRLYETTDGCRSWHSLWANPDPSGFWDTLSFSVSDPNLGVLLGDPVLGQFTIFRTTDGGHHWERDHHPALASNPTGEGAFAASNSSLAIPPGTRDIVFGTGGLAGARIFRFDAAHHSWSSRALPGAAKSESAGIFSLHFRDSKHGIAVGGDYRHPDAREAAAYWTDDGGRSWHAAVTMPGGYRSAVSYDRAAALWGAAGPTGVDLSRDDGRTWTFVGAGSWNALALPWAAGTQGRLERLKLGNTANVRKKKD